MTDTCEVLVVLVAVLESDMNHDVFFLWYNEDTQACVFHKGCGKNLEQESNGVFELPVEIVLINVRTTSLSSSLSELVPIEDTTITIANSEHLQCLKPCRKSAGMVSRRWW